MVKSVSVVPMFTWRAACLLCNQTWSDCPELWTLSAVLHDLTLTSRRSGQYLANIQIISSQECRFKCQRLKWPRQDQAWEIILEDSSSSGQTRALNPDVGSPGSLHITRVYKQHQPAAAAGALIFDSNNRQLHVAASPATSFLVTQLSCSLPPLQLLVFNLPRRHTSVECWRAEARLQ